MIRPATSDLADQRLAFWGYTNRLGADAAFDLARQLRRCEGACGVRVSISHFFYELPVEVDGGMAEAVRDAGGPSRYDGGWDALADALSADGRGFEAIICSGFDRISRRADRFFARTRQISAHGVALLSADTPALGWDVADFGHAVWCTSG